MESSHERVKVKFSYSSVAFVAIVSSLTIIIIHGPQECQTLSLSQTFSVPQSHREIVWNFHAITYTNLLLRGSFLFNFISGSPIIMPMPNSSVDPNFAEIAWQGDAAGGNNETSSTSSSDEDSSEPTSKIICASSTSCTSQSSPSQNETRIVRKMKSEKERLRLELLKQIKSLDHMKCFPKVLCGLSVDSSKTSTGIDSHLVRSYIQLMRTAKPEDDSSEESKPSLDSTKDALSLFLMKSGILPAKKKRRKDASISASSSEEDEEEDDDPFSLEDQQTIPYKSSIERKNEQLKEFLKLSKRKLAISDDFDGLDSYTPRNHTYINPLEFSHQKGYTRPVVYMSSGQSANGNSDGGESETSSITGQIGSLVSSWVPWVSLSFGADSFEKDPFFTGGKSKKTSDINEQIRSQSEAWKELDKLTYLMKLKKEIEWKKAKLKKRKLGRMNDESHNEGDDYDLPHPHEIADGELNEYADYGGEDYLTSARLSRDLKASADSEIVIYSTAVEIGKKLKDPRQCDYLYNGCPISYAEILKIITSIRKDIKEEDETTEMLTKEMVDYLPSRTKLTQKEKHTASSIASAVAAAKNKKKTQSKSQHTRNKPHLKQQQQKHNVQPVRNKLEGKKQSAQHQQQSPITKISHILPNGEKVEINVQLSGNVDAYASNVGEDDTEIQADTEAEEEIGEVEYLEEEESLFDEDNEDQNTLTQGEVVQDPNTSSLEDPAISSSYELDDEKQDGDDFRKPTPLEIFNKISLNGVQIPSTTTSPKPKYKVTKPRPSTRRPVSTKRPKPKPKPTRSPTAATTERRPTWSKGTTKRPTTAKTARPTPRAPPAVNKLKPLMQSYIHSSSIEDDESSLESNVKKVTTKRPAPPKPIPTKPVVSSNKAKATNKNTVSPNKRNNTKTSRTSKRPVTTTPKTTSLSPNSSKTSVPRRKKPTRRPTATKSTSKPEVTTSRYKVSKQTRPPTGNNETDTIFPTVSSAFRNHTKTRNKVSSTKKPTPVASLAHSADTKPPHLKRKPGRKPSGTTPIIMTTSTASTTTLPPLAMFTKSVMDDVIQEFYHKKHIHFPIPAESPPTTGTNLNGKKKQSQNIASNGMMGSQLVQIGSEGSSATLGDESFISIETEVSGELKLHSGKKKEQLGGSGGVAGTTAGATGDDQFAFSSSKDDSLSKSKRNSGESSSLESSSKKRIKYKNPKLPHLVILSSSSLDSPNIPNPILTSAERGTASGSEKKRNKGYTVSNKKPNTSKLSGNPLELPPYVFDSYSPDNPYRPR